MESSETNKKPSIIIDNGSGFSKVGFGGEKEPKTILATCVGYPKYSYSIKGGNTKSYFIGKDAESKRGILKLQYPIEHGIITNWDDMERIWESIFTNELNVNPEEHSILLSEAPLNSNKNRETMAQIMFEDFNIPALYVENQALLAACYFGKTTAVILDSGDSVTNCIPIVESVPISNALNNLNFAGRELTKYMSKILAEIGCRFNTDAEMQIIQKIKEKTCYVALNYEDELKSFESYDYKLPDGTQVVIKDQRIRCPEALFNPSIISKEGKSIAQICHESIQKCSNKNLEQELYNNIILSGGNTMFKGFPERLRKEMRILASPSMKGEIKIIANSERNIAAWKGASILSTISLFDNRWITKKEYEEKGSSVVHKNINNINLNSYKTEKKDKVTPIYNQKLSLLPTIIVHVDYDGEINEELYNNLKKELSEIIKNKNFAITDLRKGSTLFKVALLGELAGKGIKASAHNDSCEEVNSVLKKIETKKFVCLGNNFASEAKYNTPDFSKEENRIKLVNFLNESDEGIIQASSAISKEEFDNIIDKTIDNVTDVAIAQEINQKQLILYKLEEFNTKIESILEQAKKDSIFEFCIAGISLINRDITEYQNNKNNCQNLKTRFLFHGTSSNSSSFIVTTNFFTATTAFFGPGIYMTDMLDYAGFYAFTENRSKFENHNRIRKKDDTFVIVVSQIYYNDSLFEKYYEKTNEEIPDEGIRFVNVNAYGGPLSKEQTKENGYKGFIGTEYVLPDKKQILPLYSITLKRSEYYCLWKDYHFTHQTVFTKHALHVQNIAKQLLGINVYGVGEIDEALEIIKRKRFNKVIIMSNVGDNIDMAKQFIKDIREILKFNVVILFFTSRARHSEWIKEIPNVLFTTRDKHFKNYILNFNENGLNKLKEDIENDYGVKLDKFNADLSYPLYKDHGRYSSLEIN